jgi:recombinational DNA repair ATPase RecF
MLKRLEVSALRGATRKFCLDFEAGRKITIIYGENGSGKSTICDAVELLASGKVGSLEGKGLGKTESYWHSTGARPADMQVTLSSTSGQWSARAVRGKVIVSPEQGRPRAAVLRRGQILGLIAQRPGNRFDAIRPFLDTEAVEKSEAALKQLIDQETANQRTALARIEENRIAVDNFWQEAGRPGREALAWARAELRTDTSGLQAESDSLQRLIECAEALLAEERRLAQSETDVSAAQATLQSAAAQAAQEQARAAQHTGALVTILQAADAYFETHGHGDVCPLCGSDERAPGLPDQVRQQLQSFAALTAALARSEETGRNLTAAEAIRDRQRLAVATAASALVARFNSEPSWRTKPPLAPLSAAAERFQGCTDAERLTCARSLAGEAGLSLDMLRAARGQRQKRLLFAQALCRSVETYDENYKTQAELEFLLPHLKHALQVVQKERRQFVDNILEQVAGRVGELYEAIHPGEGLSRISLALDPDRRASLEIYGPFPATEAAPPGAYFSESHLDTLGLCIWLALAEMNDPKNTILVLDDVIASVDEPHVDRTVDLLYDLAQNFQHCIYTTHYKPWREKYRWGWLRNGQCHFVDLVGWSHNGGIQHGRSVPPVEELRGLLAAPQPSPQLACASAGVILEAILDFLTQQYECSVPRRKGKLALGDLLPSVSKKLRAALRIERQEIAPDGAMSYVSYNLGPLLDELTGIVQARNVYGAHFNDLAFELPERDALRFAGCVLTLADYLIDGQHGWPASAKSGSYWANGQQTRRLHPLKQPG